MGDGAVAATAWVTIVITLGVAIVGWFRANRAEHHAKTANEHAATANTIAEEAITLARSAEDRADRLERIALEKRDVAWERREVGPLHAGVLSFVNIGSDPAYDVELIVDPIEEALPRKVERFPRINPTEPIGIHLSAIAQDAATRGGGGNWHLTQGEFSVQVRVRITWRSESGVPDHKEWPSITAR